MKKVPAGTLLYKVYAVMTPNAPKVHIGNLVTTSPFTESEYGDRYLFFKHQDMVEDVKTRPEWVNHMQFAAKSCPFQKKYQPEK